jgi:hypothetical protein
VWSNESASDSDFVGYNVYISTVPGGPYSFVGSAGTATSYVVGGLSSGTTYYFVVRGADTVQESGNSPEASGATGSVSNPNPTPIACNGTPPPVDCTPAGGPPDGNFLTIEAGQSVILDLGPNNGILDNPLDYDFVYYEREATPAISYRSIQMDWVTIELSSDAATWHVAFAWSQGNEALAQNSNVRDYAVSGGVNSDLNFCDLSPDASPNEVIPMLPGGEGFCTSAPGLYGTLPYKTGIAIDINGVIPSPTGEGYRYIRITAGGFGPEAAEIDAIERLH